MHPTVGYDLANARITDMRQQAQRDALARAARQAGRARTRPTADGPRCEALFASELQPSDAPSADSVAAAIRATVARFGIGDCALRMAQEFGDHPEAAAERMHWVRSLLGRRPPPSRSPRPTGH
jgi:hypothetical protein